MIYKTMILSFKLPLTIMLMSTYLGDINFGGFWGLILSSTGIFMMASRRKHLLVTLLSLEFAVLGLFFMLSSGLSLLYGNFLFSMVLLTFSVCEGSLGLTILVSMVRSHGNDYYQVTSTN